MSYNYKGICNNPFERSRLIYPYCWWDGVFTNEELDKICEYFNRTELERGVTVGQDVANAEVSISKSEAQRVSMLKFHSPNEENYWMFDRLNTMFDLINSRFYNLDLNGYDSVQYTVYHDHEQGKYDWHMDTIMDKSIDPHDVEVRKLSITMLLNEPGVDFEGGDFEINTGSEERPLKVETKRGRIIAFPSFMIHRVAPVTKGTRKSLVVWILGPKFR